MTPTQLFARSWRRPSPSHASAFYATLAFAIATGVSWHPPVLRADDAVTLESLRKDKLAAAKEWHESALGAFLAGTARCTALYESSQAWKEAEYELARDKNERLTALRAHADRMRALFDKYDSINDVLEIPFADSLRMLRFWSLEARVSLVEAM